MGRHSSPFPGSWHFMLRLGPDYVFVNRANHFDIDTLIRKFLSSPRAALAASPYEAI